MKGVHKNTIDIKLPYFVRLLESSISSHPELILKKKIKGSFSIESRVKMSSMINGERSKFYISGKIKAHNEKTNLTYRVRANGVLTSLPILIPLQGMILPLSFIAMSKGRSETSYYIGGFYILFCLFAMYYCINLAKTYKNNGKLHFDNVLKSIEAGSIGLTEE